MAVIREILPVTASFIRGRGISRTFSSCRGVSPCYSIDRMISMCSCVFIRRIAASSGEKPKSSNTFPRETCVGLFPFLGISQCFLRETLHFDANSQVVVEYPLTAAICDVRFDERTTPIADQLFDNYEDEIKTEGLI